MRLLVIAAALLTACGSDSPTTPSGTTYDIYTIGDAFSPAYQELVPNDAVLWHFAGGSDGEGHNVRFFPKVTGAPSDVPVQKTGTIKSVFTTKGDFRYVCDVHPGMQGEIVVK